MLAALAREIHDTRVLAAFADVPREWFVPPESFESAYEDRPLPIGFNQTISQPAIVAMTLQALALTGDERVLDVGTGSGYQAALLSRLAREVVSVERIPELATEARGRLQEHGFANVLVVVAEDRLGWPDLAPYDGIAVAAAAPTVPDDLFEQLADGGRLVIPVGRRDLQELVVVRRRGSDRDTQTLGACRFVPLIGRGAWQGDA